MLYFWILKTYTFTSDAAVRVGNNILHTLKHNVDFRQLLSLRLCDTFVFLKDTLLHPTLQCVLGKTYFPR